MIAETALSVIQAGTLLNGRYRLERELGAGSTASVWRAMDERLHTARAVKLLLPRSIAIDPRLRSRLATEARAMARVVHPHVLRVYDVGLHEGRDFVVMELAEGGSLSDQLRGRGVLPPGEAVDAMLDVLDALAAAHAAGIVHRDVKPQNILLDGRGRVLLADFGIALVVAEDVQRSTRTGMAMGSLAFMAPEQRLDARSVGPQADIYAVASTLYLLVTGDSPMDLFVAPPDSQRWRRVPASLQPALQSATRYEVVERPADALAFAELLRSARPALGGVVRARGVDPSPAWEPTVDTAASTLPPPALPPAHPPRRSPLPLLAGMAGLTGLLALIYWNTSAPPRSEVEGAPPALPDAAPATPAVALRPPGPAAESPAAPSPALPEPTPSPRSALAAPGRPPEPAPKEAPEEVAGASPVRGRWLLSINGISGTLHLSGPSPSIQARIVTGFGERSVTTRATGTYDEASRRLVLEEPPSSDNPGRFEVLMPAPGEPQSTGSYASLDGSRKAQVVVMRP